MSRKGGTGGGGWVHPKGANSMVTSGLIFRSDLVGTGRAISILFGINGHRNKLSYLVGPPFLAFTAHFSATPGWHFPRALIESLLIVGVVRVLTCRNWFWEKFEAQHPKGTEIRGTFYSSRG